MANPRVFISSTFYDLQHIRASLTHFIEGLGFEPVLSETGGVAYTPDQGPEESCYAEVSNADILVLIIGGRYGSIASAICVDSERSPSAITSQQESITRREFQRAQDASIPVFILIDKGVYGEYQTYTLNRDNDSVEYAHVDSILIFEFIESVLNLRTNNPVFPFGDFNEISSWLRTQWAGIFRELLRKSGEQKAITSLSAKIEELAEVSETLKRYMTLLIESEGTDSARKTIAAEELRLKTLREHAALHASVIPNIIFSAIDNPDDINNDALQSFIVDLQEATSFEDWLKRIRVTEGAASPEFLRRVFEAEPGFKNELNELREALDAAPFEYPRFDELLLPSQRSND